MTAFASRTVKLKRQTNVKPQQRRAIEAEAKTRSTSYDLIDFESGNLVGSYATEEEARAIVRRAREADGPTAAEGLGLIRVEDGGQTLVAEEADLLRDVVAPAQASAPRP